jgi:hypothetical protein
MGADHAPVAQYQLQGYVIAVRAFLAHFPDHQGIFGKQARRANSAGPPTRMLERPGGRSS